MKNTLPLLSLLAVLTLSGCYITPESRRDCFDREMDELDQSRDSIVSIQDELRRIKIECEMSDDELSDAILDRNHDRSYPYPIPSPSPMPIPDDKCEFHARYGTMPGPSSLRLVQMNMADDDACRVSYTIEGGLTIFIGKSPTLTRLASVEQAAGYIDTFVKTDQCRRAKQFCATETIPVCMITLNGDPLGTSPIRSEGELYDRLRRYQDLGICY